MLISFFFLFQECCCGLCDRPCGWRWSGPAFVGHHQNGQKIPWRREPLCFIGFSELTKVFCLVGRKLLYYSYLVYCKPFNVLFRGSLAGAAKNVAKLQVLFETRKFFAIFFSTFFSEAPRLSGPRRTVCALAGPPSQKRVQSYTFPPFPPNISPKKFTKTMFSSIDLTFVCNCQNCISGILFMQYPVYSEDKAKLPKTTRTDLQSRQNLNKKSGQAHWKIKMRSRKLIKRSPSFLPPDLIPTEIKRATIAPPNRIL